MKRCQLVSVDIRWRIDVHCAIERSFHPQPSKTLLNRIFALGQLIYKMRVISATALVLVWFSFQWGFINDWFIFGTNFICFVFLYLSFRHSQAFLAIADSKLAPYKRLNNGYDMPLIGLGTFEVISFRFKPSFSFIYRDIYVVLNTCLCVCFFTCATSIAIVNIGQC